MNFLIENEFTEQEIDLLQHIFGDEEATRVSQDKDIYDCLVMIGAFKSKSEARKNWTRTGKNFESGYNEYTGIGKKRLAMYVWNPVDTRSVS
jgi:hypothetical protein